MQPRYLEGTKVRIRTSGASRQFMYRELETYENMSGVVLSSKAVIAYVFHPMISLEQSYTDAATTLNMYTVKLEDGIMLYSTREFKKTRLPGGGR